ncbi:MAG: hypothetical protein HC780_13420 [Leptolyngbyaceae cyanobacterium CSU_1_3]|nr:hypothetical protein [Leptolyngbyaceae cyanobacterium CSU_1_3]
MQRSCLLPCHLVSRSSQRSTIDRPFSPKQSPAFYGNLPDKGTIALQLKNGVETLGRSLNGVSDPVATLKLLNNLLNAAVNSVSLNEVRIASNAGGLDPRGDIRSASFIRELVKFGVEVARVNPTVTTTDETMISEFLNTLWSGGDERKAHYAGLNKHMTNTFKFVQLVCSPEEINNYYEIASRVIGGLSSEYALWVIKQEYWTAVAASASLLGDEDYQKQFAMVLAQYGYTEIKAVGWHKDISPSALIVPVDVNAFDEVRRSGMLVGYALFMGQPDWLIFVCTTLDYMLVMGMPKFVEDILAIIDYTAEQAFSDLREYGICAQLTPEEREFYLRITDRLQFFYPKIAPGEIIDLGWLNIA